MVASKVGQKHLLTPQSRLCPTRAPSTGSSVCFRGALQRSSLVRSRCGGSQIASDTLRVRDLLMSAVLLRRAGRRSLSLASSLLTAQRSVACRASLPAAAETATAAVSQTSVVVSQTSSQPVPFQGVRGFATGSGLAGGAFVIRRVPQATVPSLPASADGSSLSGARGASAAAASQPHSPGRSLATSATPFCNLAAVGGYSDFEEAPFGHPAPSFAASGLGGVSADASGDAGESESEDDVVAVAQVRALQAVCSTWPGFTAGA